MINNNFLTRERIKPFCCVLVLIIFCSNTLNSQIFLQAKLLFAIYMLISLTVLWFFGKMKIKKQEVRVVLFLVGCIMLSMIINLDFNNFNGNIIVAAQVVSAFVFAQSINRKKFWGYYRDAMLLISAYSLILNYVFPIFSLEKVFPVISNKLNVQFYYSVISVKIKSYGYFEARNYGIFSEPAVFVFFIFCALYIDYCSEKEVTKKIAAAVVLVLAMFSTFSPVGILTAIFFLALYLNEIHKATCPAYIKIGIVALIFFGVFFIFSTDVVNSGVTGALSKATIERGNGKGRMDALLLNLDYWVQKPFFGNSIGVSEQIANRLGFNTTSTGAMLSCYGFLFSIAVSFLQCKSMLFFSRSKPLVVRILTILCFEIIINNHGFLQSEWYWLFSLIALGDNNNEASDYLRGNAKKIINNTLNHL